MLVHLILGTLTIAWFEGTGDSGDSIYHYLFARSAPYHPELYFDHWAKPLFVLLFSPMAQLGFVGVKILNLILVNLTLYLTFRSAEILKVGNPFLVTLLLICSPLYFVLTFSGLTEPMFACVLMLALFFQLKQRYILTLIIISFLPFVRTEGLFFIGIFGLWEVIQGRYRNVMYLTIGTVAYSIAGYFVYHDLFWTITKIPYSRLSSTYGSGTAFHFVEQMIYVTGVPFYVLFWLGTLTMSVRYFRKQLAFKIPYFLIGGVVAFILAHSIFWYFGIFNSMGLKRVLLCVIPFMALIAAHGIQEIKTLIYLYSPRISILIVGLITVYILIFPFTRNPAAIDFENDLDLHTEQIEAQKVKQFLQQNYTARKIITGNTYFCELLDIDCFDATQKVFITRSAINSANNGDLIIWDNWFAVVEHGILLEELEENPKMKIQFETENTSSSGRYSKMVVFEVIY
jgi:hypothetical protein